MDVNVVYIDDDIDNLLSRYLEQGLMDDISQRGIGDVSISYNEIAYNPASGFKELLSCKSLQEANIAIIDSKLFEVESSDKGMLTGEQFRLVLRKYYPFIESLVITQIGSRQISDLQILPKYDRDKNIGEGPDEFYGKNLVPKIIEAIDNLRAYRLAIESLGDGVIDDIAKEKIENSIEGIQDYMELTPEDIDRAVEAFEGIKGLVSNAGK